MLGESQKKSVKIQEITESKIIRKKIEMKLNFKNEVILN